MTPAVKDWLYWCIYIFGMALIVFIALDDWGDSVAFMIGVVAIIFGITRVRPRRTRRRA